MPIEVVDFFAIETDTEALSRKGGSNSTRSFSIIIRDMTTSTEKFLQQKQTDDDETIPGQKATTVHHVSVSLRI